ncbi:MAG: methyltransferase domain-containing protein [Thermoleophilaceae bacterium]
MTPVCPACRCDRSRPAMRIRELAFRRCSDCRSLFVTDPPPATALQTLYEGEEYFANPAFGLPEKGGYHGYRDYLADRRHIEDKFGEVLEHVERPGGPGRLVDVGAGPGFMVAAAATRGWRAIGVDLNPWAVARARAEGLDVRQTGLEDAGFEDGEFDCVTMMDLLEHVAEPGALVEEAARVVRPGGTLAVLTPDAGSPVSRALGARWPEVQRAPEHLVLFTAAGLASLLGRHGFAATGWHSVGKTSSLATLGADVAPAAPAALRAGIRLLASLPVAERSLDLDPRTKLCLYATRLATPSRDDSARARPVAPPRVPKRASQIAPERTVAEDLAKLARARRLCDWMYEQVRLPANASAVEVGAGIGTFSERLLADGARRLVLVEPEPSSADELERRFVADTRVVLLREELPGAPGLAPEAGCHDLVLCQNVLEHIEDEAGAVCAMSATLRPGGTMTVLVPAEPRLYGSLDHAYGHHRRYTRDHLRGLLTRAGLEVQDIYSFNLLGVPGWWLSSLRGARAIGAGSLAAYDQALVAWRPLERALRPRVGLSLVAHARRPAQP